MTVKITKSYGLYHVIIVTKTGKEIHHSQFLSHYQAKQMASKLTPH